MSVGTINRISFDDLLIVILNIFLLSRTCEHPLGFRVNSCVADRSRTSLRQIAGCARRDAICEWSCVSPRVGRSRPRAIKSSSTRPAARSRRGFQGTESGRKTAGSDIAARIALLSSTFLQNRLRGEQRSRIPDVCRRSRYPIQSANTLQAYRGLASKSSLILKLQLGALSFRRCSSSTQCGDVSNRPACHGSLSSTAVETPP